MCNRHPKRTNFFPWIGLIAIAWILSGCYNLASPVDQERCLVASVDKAVACVEAADKVLSRTDQASSVNQSVPLEQPQVVATKRNSPSQCIARGVAHTGSYRLFATEIDRLDLLQTHYLPHAPGSKESGPRAPPHLGI